MSTSTSRLQPGEIEITFTHPAGPGKKSCAVRDDTTGDQVITGLIAKKFLDPEHSELQYSLALDNGNGKSTELVRKSAFTAQGVKSGDTVKIVSINAGAMPGLSPERFRTRVAYDYRVVDGLLPHPSLDVVAYRKEPSQREPRLSRAEGLAGHAMVYDVSYTFPVLIDAGRTSQSTKARFVLDANGQYPISAPSVQFLGDAVPWCPHVQHTTGLVCIGNAWKSARGRRLFAQLLLQVADLINFNEPDAGRDYEFNNDALEYWRLVLNRRPYNPNLSLPTLPVDITHGHVAQPRPEGFRNMSVCNDYRRCR